MKINGTRLEKISPRKITGGTRVNSQSNSRIPDSGPEKCFRKN